MMTTCTSLVYDYIIIGGGLAGLYTYERLQEKNGDLNILLLEKNDYLGGRMKEQEFHGTSVKLGAGIIDETCPNMINILKRHQVKINKSDSIHVDNYLPKFDMNEAINLIKTTYDKETNSEFSNKCRIELTVDKFLHKHFSPEFIELFYLYADFSDFYNQDINDFILKYPIDDLKREPSFIYFFSFKDLIDKLSKNKNILLNYKVQNVKRVLCNNKEIFSVNDHYFAYNIITATTINCLKNIFDYDFLNKIKSVPFYRNYVYSDNLSAFKNGTIMVNNEIKKIIKINKNIIMLVYCDNYHAEFWKNVHEISEQKQSPNIVNHVLKKLLKENSVELDVNILDSVHQYWNEGIHYYEPCTQDRTEWIIKHMNPERGIYIVGEMIGIKQGWMEAALESVVLLFKNYLDKKIS